MSFTRTSAARNEKLDELVSTMPGRKYIEEVIQHAVKKAVKETINGELGRLTAKLDAYIAKLEEENRSLSKKLDDLRGDIGLEHKTTKKARAEGGNRPVPDVQYLPVTASEISMVRRAMGRVTWRQCTQGHYFSVGECGTVAQSAVCMECRTVLR
ncbi:hypothetical protein FBU59_006684 [Linderina macrospora]|uniref:Uncharacterized protein n=1 Tax=Linderina macrospora TaxID=4868 RepID=A0ACC1IZ61_9FUNG|nr:hypothetical protein FBU59_006684 [Linderina macrospora]